MSLQPPDPQGFRISDADRERAAGRLHQALAEGRITVSELEERLSVVYAARYEADLRPPLADLPPDPAVAVAPSAPGGAPVVLRSGMSGIKRTGLWSVPPRLRVESSMGSVLLDFTEADNPHPVVEVGIETVAGSVRLLVPDDATANLDDVVATMGAVKSRVPSRPTPGSPHFVVHGRSAMGSVVVRRKYRLGRARV